jgi:hypothetical protein
MSEIDEHFRNQSIGKRRYLDGGETKGASERTTLSRSRDIWAARAKSAERCIERAMAVLEEALGNDDDDGGWGKVSEALAILSEGE